MEVTWSQPDSKKKCYGPQIWAMKILNTWLFASFKIMPLTGNNQVALQAVHQIAHATCGYVAD